jgi:hypothetical protein
MVDLVKPNLNLTKSTHKKKNFVLINKKIDLKSPYYIA